MATPAWKTVGVRDVVIPDAAQVPDAALSLDGALPLGITFPAGMEGTTIKYLVSTDNSTFVEMIDTAGADVQHTVAASKYLPLDSALFAGVLYLKLRIGTAQNGAATLKVHVRGL